jgi:hypothetical protein
VPLTCTFGWKLAMCFPVGLAHSALPCLQLESGRDLVDESPRVYAAAVACFMAGYLDFAGTLCLGWKCQQHALEGDQWRCHTPFRKATKTRELFCVVPGMARTGIRSKLQRLLF